LKLRDVDGVALRAEESEQCDQCVITATEGATRCGVRLPQFVPVMLTMSDDASMRGHVSGHHGAEIV
jgi:hypothetical protein